MADSDFGKGIDAGLVEEGKPIGGCVDGKPVVLVRHGGKICALAGECTHHGAPLADGAVIDGELRCPWHHARFSVETGEAVGAPAFAPLDRFEVVEQDGVVTVTGPADVAQPEHRPAKDPGQVVIIGGGAAGHACGEMLARYGVTATIIDADQATPYDRTACSKEFLSGEADRDEVALPTLAGFRADATVDRIDTVAREVVLSDGEAVAYDTLVIATGAEPRIPDFEGADCANVYRLRTLDDAELIATAAKDAGRAIIVGASFIGLEVAASLIQRGLSVTVIGKGKVPLAKVVGKEVGAHVRSLHEHKGVTFRMGREITAFDGKRATLDDGSGVEGGMLIVGAGVTPRTGLAEAAGIALADEDSGGGIAVDGRFRTSADHVHAIGDVAAVPDPRLDRPIRVEHWVVAQRHGQWLARHLVGAVEGDYGDAPFFWSNHYDTSLAYVGHVEAPEDRTVDGDVEDEDFAVRYREDGEEQALLTCNRDAQSLRREAELDR